MSICLSMIVKNEEPVIRRAFDSIKNHIDYWIIYDTGSTDRTKEIIAEFAKEVPGELHESNWVNFAHNRNEALNTAKTKADYVITMDADEYFSVDGFDPKSLSGDGYHINTIFGSLKYARLLIMSSKRNWQYVGVVHEIPTIVNEQFTVNTVSGITLNVTTEGNRSNNPYKFLKDAELLEKAIKDEPDNGRYVFYLAQSYKDLAGSMPTLAKELNEKAIFFYKKRLTMEGFYEEKFIAHYHIAKLSTDDSDVVYHALEAYNLIPERLEPLHFLINYYNWRGKYRLSELLLDKAMNPHYPDKYFLFVERNIYIYEIYDAMFVTAYWINDNARCIELAKKLHSVIELIPDYHKKRILDNIKHLENRLSYKVI